MANGLQKNAHALLPFVFADHGQPVNVIPMVRSGFRILPQAVGRPAMKIMHRHQQANFMMLLNQRFMAGTNAS